MKSTVLLSLLLAGPAAAFGVCDNPPCHAATGPVNYDQSWQQQLVRDQQANPQGPVEFPTAYGLAYSGTITATESACVDACQEEQQAWAQQQQAAGTHQPFLWKQCQDKCFPNQGPVVDVVVPSNQMSLAQQLQIQAQQKVAQQKAQAQQQLDQQRQQQAQQQLQQQQQAAQQNQNGR